MDDNGGGGGFLQHFVNGHPQNGQIYPGQAVQRPSPGKFGNQAVDFLLTRHDAFIDADHEIVFVFAFLHLQQVHAGILAAVAAHFPFVNQLHGLFPRSSPVHVYPSFIQ